MKTLRQYTIPGVPVEVQIIDAGGRRFYNIYELVLPEECSHILSYMKEYFLTNTGADPGRQEDRWIAAEILG